MSSEDPFAYREQGGRFTIGTPKDGSTRAFIEIDNELLALKSKSIYRMKLPDSIDPKRTNHKIPTTQQKVLSYGSESPLVGRTLQQASVLFEPSSLPEHIDTNIALSISLSFLKELVSLEEIKVKYLEQEVNIKSSFNGNLDEDNSLHLPTTEDIEQKVNMSISHIDHCNKLLMRLVQLFYPDIPKELWNIKLQEKLVEQFGEEHPAVEFLKSVQNWLWLARELRNEIEHPSEDRKLLINNYELQASGKVTMPTVNFNLKRIPLKEMSAAEFMIIGIENSVSCFELLSAHLCNLHATPFAMDKRVVSEVPQRNRDKAAPHTRF